MLSRAPKRRAAFAALRLRRRALQTLSLSVFVSGTFLLGHSVRAATDTYVGNPTNTFTGGFTPAPTNGDTLVFGVPGIGGTTITDNIAALTVGGSNTDGIDFSLSAAAYTINPFAASGYVLTLASSGTGIGINDLSLNAETINVPLALTSTQTINVGNRAGSLTLGGVISGTGFGLTKTGNGLLTLSGANSFTGGVTINGGTLAVASDGTGTTNPLGTGASGAPTLTINGGTLRTSGTMQLSTNRGIALGSSTANTGGTFDVNGATTTYKGVITNNGGTNSLTKTGTGTLALGGVNLYTGNTNVNQGTLNLDFTGLSGTTTNIINSGSTLVLGGVATTLNTPQAVSGETLTVSGKTTASSNVSQTFAGVTLNQGNSTISTTQGISSSGVLLNLNGITHNAGGVVNFSLGGTASATNAITTTTANDASGILGGYATYNGTDYATNGGAGVGIKAVAAYTAVAANGVITDSGAGTPTNINLTGGGTMTTSGTTNGATNINTIRQGTATASTVNVTGTLRLGPTGGILAGLGANLTINGGTLTAGGNTLNTAGEIIINNNGGFNQTVTIGSVIANNNSSTGAANSSGAGAVSLTINAPGTGSNGTDGVLLNGANTYSGGTFINAGRVLTGNATAYGTGAVTVLSGGEAYVNKTISNNFFIAGLGTGENNGNGAIRAQGGTLNGTVTLIGDARIGANGGTGTFNNQITGNYNLDFGNGTVVLANTTANANNWSGNTTITSATVNLGASNQIPDGSLAGNVTINNGSTLDLKGFSDTINGLSATATVGQGTVTNSATGASVLTIGGNDQTSTFNGLISDSGVGKTLGITKTGAGLLTLGNAANTYTGATTINGGTLKVGSITGAGAVSVNGGTTLGFSGTTGSLGGAVTVAGGSTAATQGTVTLINNVAGDVITLSNAGGLTVGGSTSGNVSNLGFDVNYSGSTATADKLASTNPFTVNAGGALLTINSLGGIAAGQSYTLLTYGSGTGAGFATGMGATVGSLTLANPALSFGVTGALTVTSTSVALTTSGASAPATAYFSGAQGSAWNSLNAGQTAGNFTTDQAGTNFVQAYPASTTDVIYTADNATSYAASTLGQNFDIKSLTFRGTGSPTATNAVNLGGSNALNIEAGGITLQAGNAGVTLSMSNLNLGVSQSYTNNSSNPFTIASTTAIASNATTGTTTLTLSNTGTGTTTVNGTIGNGTGTNAVAVVVNNTGTGTGATTTFSGTNTYTGGTTVNGGTLATTDNVNAFGTNGSGTTVNIGNTGTVLINSNTNNTYSDTFSGSGKLLINLNNGGGDTLLATNSISGFTGIIELANTTNSGNKLQINGTVTTAATLQIDNQATYFTGTGTVNFGAITIVGVGNNENRGAIRLTGNGTTTVAPTTGIVGGNISLLGNTTIGNEGGALTGNISTGVAGTSTLTMGTSNNAATSTATLSGNVSDGTGTLVLTAAYGTTTLTGTNTYSGVTTINSGATLQLGDGTSSHDGTVAGTSGITDNGTLIYNRFGATSSSRVISGTGGLTMTGTGTQTLSGANTYSGPTTVNTGTLLATNMTGSATGTGVVTVNSGGTLGGTGTIGAGGTTTTINGKITGGTDGTVAGNAATAINTLNVASALTINGTYVADISSSTNTSDKLSISGVLNVTNATLNLNGTITPNFTYVLATYASIMGTFTTPNLPSGEYLVYGATQLTLVPEPGTWAGGLLLVGTFGFSQRRRLRAWHFLRQSA